MISVTAAPAPRNRFPIKAGRCRPKRQPRYAPSRKQNHAANPGKGMPASPSNSPVVVRSMAWDPAHPSREVLLNREWLVSNGLGGYASGTVSGAITRKYHGILVAALPAPLGRVVMWNHVS